MSEASGPTFLVHSDTYLIHLAISLEEVTDRLFRGAETKVTYENCVGLLTAATGTAGTGSSESVSSGGLLCRELNGDLATFE